MKMPRKAVQPIKMSEQTRVTFPPLHAAQMKVDESDARFKVLVAGRRFGKSLFARQTVLHKAINEGKIVWFVSPTYNNVQTHWRAAKRMVGNLATYQNEQQKYMEFEIGNRFGSIAFKSGDSPNNLLGEGLDYVVVDEAAYQDEELWFRVLRPSLADKQGGALLISTPNGVTNWFYRMYLAGLDELQPAWQSWVFRTIDNPYIAQEEIDAAEQDLPELKFKQEFLAQFVSDAGGVFRNLENAARVHTLLEPELPPEGVKSRYVAGVDWGRKNDFTVVTIVDIISGEQKHIERFSEIGYKVQRDRIWSLYEKWNIGKFYIESNAAGAPNIEALEAEGLPIQPVYMTNPVKTQLIEAYAANIERDRLKLISSKERIGQLQIGELQAYSIERSRSGLQITYNAPRGMHDDMVISGALANIPLTEKRHKELTITANPFYGGAKKPAPSPDDTPERKEYLTRLRMAGLIDDDRPRNEDGSHMTIDQYREKK
jgi:terminase large subunit-like protein